MGYFYCGDGENVEGPMPREVLRQFASQPQENRLLGYPFTIGSEFAIPPICFSLIQNSSIDFYVSSPHVKV